MGRTERHPSLESLLHEMSLLHEISLPMQNRAEKTARGVSPASESPHG